MLALTNMGTTMNNVLGNCLNKAEEYREHGGCYRVASHGIGLFVVIPVESVALLVNTVRLIFEAIAKCFIKLALAISNSLKKYQCCANWNQSLQQLDEKTQPLETSIKVATLILGLVVSSVCAWSSPYANYAAHKLFELTNDKVEPLNQQKRSSTLHRIRDNVTRLFTRRKPIQSAEIQRKDPKPQTSPSKSPA